MASRNIKPSSVQGFDSPNVNDKMQSSTLKRQPSPDWSKADLLRLLSYFEGELQARDITIATLKAEKAKQLLYQAKYGRFGLGDPFVALQRDAEGKSDTCFDEAAIKSMYDNQLAQLENLIATQRKAQLKMREQLGNSEKRFHKLCTELEEEKQKHAQDTAQGDDVTYMLEKERERLKAEIDFEKSQNKKLEKDLKKTLASLEEERSNAARHKQVAIMLIKERKNLIERIIAENNLRDEMETALTDGKSKIQNMAEGLAQESKKTLKMEAVIEKQSTKFDMEREALCSHLQKKEAESNVLKADVERLSKQLELFQHQVRSNDSSTSTTVRSSVSPARTAITSLPSPSTVISGAIQSPSGSTLQSCVMDSATLEHASTINAAVMPPADSSHDLEFLGPEMANLQQLLATMSTGDDVSEDSIPVANGNTPCLPQFSLLSSPLFTPSSPVSLSTVTTSQNKSQMLETTLHNIIEQNNNIVKVSRGNNEIKSTTKVTAQISPIVTKSQTSTLRIFEGQSPSTPVFTAQIVPPIVVNPLVKTLVSSPKISSTVSKSSLNFSPATSSSSSIINSPSMKRKSMQSRPRSKSPLKTSYNHSRSYSASARISTDTHTPVTTQPRSSRLFVSSSSVPSLRLPPAAEVNASLLHHLSAIGKVEALGKIVTDRKGDVNLTLKDGTTPLHCAVENNQEASMKILLQNGAKPSSLRNDRVTPLHIAALKGYTSCVRLLLSKGAAVNLSTTANQSPLHLAVKAGHLECCHLLLRHGANILYKGQDGLTSMHYAVQNNHHEVLKILLDKLKSTGISRVSDTAYQIVAITDKDGWTITHMAAHLLQKECLVLLAENLPLDFEVKDKLGRSVKTVASAICKELLDGVDQPQISAIKTIVELKNVHENTTVSSVLLGIIDVESGLSWSYVEDLLQGTLKSYLNQLNTGLKTRRITRLDADFDRVDKDFTLGLMMANIKHFEIGFYKWTPGMQTDTSPYTMLSNVEHKKATITVNDCDNMCELIAFDVLHPVSNISNYLRLLEQYKSVIFYGPTGSGKSYLAHKLAQSIAARELSIGHKPAIYQLSLQTGHTFVNFLTFLKQRNCVVPVNRTMENFAPILLLDNLEVVDIAQLFGELLDPIEYRGKGHAFCLRGDHAGQNGLHYLTDYFYVIGTMNKSRSLGVDLSILPRFRWIQFRLDTEPLKALLARHFYRRILNTYHGCMPSTDDPVFRAIEWIVCVWQRLNDSLNKLGIPEVIQGPCMFFKCPLEKQDHKLMLQWMQNTWNIQIAPRVREAVKRGTGSEAPSDGQQKVANTALYVLMQRTVILGCPLGGQDKDIYFAGFFGSNELDIPLKPGESKPKGVSPNVFNPNSPRSTNQHRRPNSLISTSTQSQKLTNEEENSHKSLSTSSSDFKMRNRNGKASLSSTSVMALNIKRRSLSDSSVNKSTQQEQQQQQYLDGIQSPSSSQAKMAKLEVKSQKIVSIGSAFRSPSLSSSETSTSGISLKKTGYVSPLLNVSTENSISSKKSKSSENISNNGLYGASGRLRSPGPFAFSLTTPTSSLTTFKFLDKSNNEGDVFNSEAMPDFSIFDKVPTPTDDLPVSNSFVFAGSSKLKGRTLQKSSEEVQSKEQV